MWISKIWLSSYLHIFLPELCMHRNKSSTFVVILFILKIFCRSIFSLVSPFLIFLNHFHCCSSTFTCFFSLHLQSTPFPFFVFICLCFRSFSIFLSYFFSHRICILCLYTSIHTPTPALWTRIKLRTLWFKQYEYLKKQISKSASKLRYNWGSSFALTYLFPLNIAISYTL